MSLQTSWEPTFSSMLPMILQQLQRPLTESPALTLNQWWDSYRKQAKGWEIPVDRAVLGGLLADRVAYAFAGGYHNALRYLVPSLPHEKIVAFCITEEGGGHPKAIQTRLLPLSPENAISDSLGAHWILSGRKKFITMAKEAELLLIAASAGKSSEGLNQIRLVSVGKTALGVQIEPLQGLPFVPEISHGTLILDSVSLSSSQILPGDGYTAYIKPFRTIEDIHVGAGILGYLLRLAFAYAWPQAIREELLNRFLNLRAIALSDVSSPGLHLILGGYLNEQQQLFQKISAYWEKVPPETVQRWNRDISLFQVAATARDKRLERAWETVGAR